MLPSINMGNSSASSQDTLTGTGLTLWSVLRRQNWESRETKAARLHWGKNQREGCSEIARGLQRRVPRCSARSWTRSLPGVHEVLIHVCEEPPDSSTGKELSNRSAELGWGLTPVRLEKRSGGSVSSVLRTGLPQPESDAALSLSDKL